LGFCVRYEKRHSNLSAHVSPAFRVKEGDKVVIGQCRLVDFSPGSIISVCKQDSLGQNLLNDNFWRCCSWKCALVHTDLIFLTCWI
jgi:hypothetical protein